MVAPSARTQASPLPIEARLVIGAIALRLFTAFIAFLAEITIPTKVDQRFYVLGQPNAFWDPFARYDSGWYYGIASKGYAFLGEGRNNLAFFPLYPTLMGWGGRLLGGNQADFYFAGVVISWVSFALAAMLLYRLALLDIPHPRAVRAVLYSGIFPAVLLRRRLFGELVLPDVDRRGPGDPRAALGVERAGRRGDDRHASQRCDVRAGAPVAGVAGQPAGTRARARSAGGGVRGGRHRRLLHLQLHAERRSLHLVSQYSALGILPGRQPGQQSSHDRQGPRHQACTNFSTTSRWRPTTP